MALNPLEVKIVDSIPAGARHVLVINAGDGRLGRAIRDKIGGGAVSIVTIQPSLMALVDDFPACGNSPWNNEWLAAKVAAHGAFDAVIFYHLHEFWHGELFQLQRVLQHARPGALVWTSFLNAQAQRMIARFLPPVRLGYPALADPLRISANVDFASFLDLTGKIGDGLSELWGILDQNAQEFCQKQPTQPVQWDIRGAKMTIGTFADAFLWGATVVGVAFHTRGGVPAQVPPKISFTSYSAQLAQMLLVPYPDHQNVEAVLGAALIEVADWPRSPTTGFGSMPRLLLEQLGAASSGAKRVLLVGCGWGRDLLFLQRQQPQWECVGYEPNSALLALGEVLRKEAGVSAVSVALDQPLPFADGAFDLVLSIGYFSTIHEPAARLLAKEALRVSKGGVYQLEDGRGPEHGMHLTSYSLATVYQELGHQAAVQAVLVDNSPIGMYLLRVATTA